MEPFLFFQTAQLSVTEVTRYLKQLLESDEVLQEVWVEGEVSNLSRPGSGHLYFTLKDQGAALRCVIWRGTAQRMRTQPQDGTLMQAHGSIGVYEAGGNYQLYVDQLRPAGEGALFAEFMRLKARLEAEGLFEAERKRPIPTNPRCIGVVTSPTGAALQDILNVIRRRYPLVEVVIAPAAVQGADAPLAIVAALRALNQQVHPDVILVARGGGSMEDLWAFNDERVVRAIVSSDAPVITGVGHETDFTLADFAGDLRAPTPSAAAMLCTPDRLELRQALAERVSDLGRLMETRLDDCRWKITDQRSALRRYSPLGYIRSQRQRLDETSHAGQQALSHLIELHHAHLGGMQMRLVGLSPQSVLQRGYAIVTHHPHGSLVSSARDAVRGEALRVRLADGSFIVRVGEAAHESPPGEAQD
jgi:exodeoxyribonuclease VII large subunit